MKEIEVRSDSGMPIVKVRLGWSPDAVSTVLLTVSQLHGHALAFAREAGLEDIQLSLSHEEDCIVAVALGTYGGARLKRLPTP